MALDVWAGAAIGRRENQEDWHSVRELGDGSGILIVVADGMGGHAAGEVASSTAGEAFVESFAGNSGQPVTERLMQAAQAANLAIADRIAEEPELDGMGTTLVAALFTGRSLSWVSIGDSLLFLVSQGAVRRLNADHSYGAFLDRQAAEGRISAEAAANDPDRHALMSCVMGKEIDLVEVTEAPLDLGQDDILIAASDGIETLSLEDIGAMARSADGGTVARLGEALFDRIAQIDRRHQDNTTIVTVRGFGHADMAREQGPPA